VDDFSFKAADASEAIDGWEECHGGFINKAFDGLGDGISTFGEYGIERSVDF
jgi:hypothetical protein